MLDEFGVALFIWAALSFVFMGWLMQTVPPVMGFSSGLVSVVIFAVYVIVCQQIGFRLIDYFR